MAESFENLDNILRDWANDKGQKRLAEALYRKDKAVSSKKESRKSSLAVSVGSRARLNQTQNWSW